MFKNNKGFSLIELMVVVAIIGVLASFAIPQYQSFQAKAKQKEGQSLLSSYYTAVKATEVDANATPLNFVSVGFNPTGQIHYRVTTTAGAFPGGTYPYSASCFDTMAATTCTPMVKAYAEVIGGAWFANSPTGCTASFTAPSTWTACASSRLSTSSTVNDTWSMTQAKVISNPTNGTY